MFPTRLLAFGSKPVCRRMVPQPNPSLALQASMVFGFTRSPVTQSGLRPRAGIPNAGNNGRDPIGDRARSLTVTALSCGAYFMISWRMKFQVSGAPAVLPHSRKKLRGVSVLRSPVSAPVPEECPIHRQINELRPFSVRI